MSRFAIAVTSFMAVATALAGAYFGARYGGIRIDLPVFVAVAAGLAASASVALLAVSVFAKPAAARAYAPTRLNEDPVWRFIAPFKEAGAIQLLVRPGLPVDILLMRAERIFKHPAEHADRKIVLTIKKAKKGGEIFNPSVLKQLFETLKPFSKSEHVLLVNEHDEFMGYIPWASAIKEFTGDNAETKIGKNIVEVFEDPAKSTRLRALGGMATQDAISDRETIYEAAKKTWFDDPMHGLVIYHGERNRKLVGVIARNSVLQLVATGA